MKKLCLLAALAALFAATSSARAWTLPDLGHNYFVGTTEELDDIRAALRQAECERLGTTIEMCTTSPNCPALPVGCHEVPNPYCGENTYPCGEQAQVLPESFGTSPLDFMQAYEDYELYPANTGTIGELYFGNTYAGTYVPAVEELSSQSELPAECIAHLEQLYCWPGSGLENMLCPDP